MKRLLSITLLLLIGLPLIAPLLALGSGTDSNLPSCCRRNGKHHCMMSVMEIDALLHGEHFTGIRSKCPLYPRATAPAPHQQYFFERHLSILIEAPSQSEKFHQVEAWARIAREGARHKRGPPTVRLS